MAKRKLRRGDRVGYSQAHLLRIGYWPFGPGWGIVLRRRYDRVVVRWLSDETITVHAACLRRPGEVDDQWTGFDSTLGSWKNPWPEADTYSPEEYAAYVAAKRDYTQVPFRKLRGEQRYYGKVNGSCCYITRVRRACWRVWWGNGLLGHARSIGVALSCMSRWRDSGEVFVGAVARQLSV